MSFKKTEMHALKEGDTILLGFKTSMEPITGTVIKVRGTVKPSHRGKTYDIGSHMINAVVAIRSDGQEVTAEQINIFREEEILEGRKQFEKVYVEEVKQGDKLLFEDQSDQFRLKYGVVKEIRYSEETATLLKGVVIEGFTKTDLLVQTPQGIKEVSETNFYKKY